MRQSRRQSEMQRQTEQFRQRVIALEDLATAQLSTEYRAALAALEPRIDALAARIAEAQLAGETVNPSWLFQEARYRELRSQLTTLIAQYGAETKAVTTATQRVIVRESLAHAGQMLLPVAGGSGDELAQLVRGWAAVPDESIVNLVGALQDGTPLAQTIESYAPKAVAEVNQALVNGLALGDSASMTARVLQGLGYTRVRAETLVRTETMRAARTATLAAYQQSGVVRGWRWSASLSSRTCAACLAMHGRVFRLTEPMRFHVNCFPAGTLCSGPQSVASSERWYVGDLVDIRLASGDHLSVTPNHPVLTPHGWVEAGLLDEGSCVIRSTLTEREVSAIYPNYQNGPSLIEKVTESVGGANPMPAISVPISPEDFHGDGIGSDVSVVRSNCLLGNGIDTAIGKPALHDELGGGGVGLPLFSGLGRLAPFLNSGLASAHGVVGLCRECLSLLGAGLSHACVHALGSVAWSYAGTQEIATNGASHDAVFRGEGFFALACKVSLDNPICRHFLGLPPNRNTSGTQNFRNPIRAAPVHPGNLLHRLAGHIAATHVVSVDRKAFSGHVYNLETTDGYYIANNIIVHNCRCSISPFNPAWADDWQTGADWLADQSTDVQRQVLGVAGQQAYFNGDVALDDFVQLHRDKTWGDSYNAGSLTYALKQAQRGRKAAA